MAPHPLSPSHTHSTSSSPTSSKPQPRPPKSPGRTAHIRVQNRRRAYLERNPEYFKSNEHELAAPLLYDILIRRFLNAEEREVQGRERGYGRLLEGSLLRGEARLERVAASYAGVTGPASSSNAASGEENGMAEGGRRREEEALMALEEAMPEGRDDGEEKWEDYLRERFVNGEDGEFDYAPVDEEDGLDEVERREAEERWFEDEEESWVSDSGGGQGGHGTGNRRDGETGVQDF